MSFGLPVSSVTCAFRFALIGALFSALLSAQSGTSVIFGTVTDSSGAAVAAVDITATNEATGITEKVKSGDTGNFVFPDLRPGSYKVSASVTGFRTTERTGVLIQVDQRARVDLELQVGNVAEILDVSASVTNVDTYSSTVKEVVDSARMQELPLNGRNALSLQALLPGAVQMGSGSAATGVALNTNLVFSVNGARPNASSYTLDGGLNMDMYNNVPAAFPNPDTLQEFSILQNGYSAVNGRNAGAVVNMVTKSGSNEYHGSLYEFLRNDKMDARNFFATRVDPLRRNQFGGTVGGPVKLPGYNGHDRAFFFFGYDGTRQVLGTVRSVDIVPTALERQGDFSQSFIRGQPITVAPPETVNAANPRGIPYPGNIIPASRLDPVALAFTNAFIPLPNRPGNIYAYNPSVPTNDNQTVMKLDYSISDANKISLRYFWDDYFRQQNVALPAFNSENNWVTHNVALNDTHIFSPRIINSANLTVARNTFIRGPLVTSPVDFAALGCKSCVALAAPSVPVDWALSVSNGLGLRVDTNYISYMMNYQFIDTVSWTLSNHLIQFGGDLAKVRRNGREYFQANPQFAFDGTRSGNYGYGYADFFQGAAATVFQNSPLSSWQYKWTPFLYFQDDWRVSRKLTVNLGVRWEPFVPAKEKNGQLGAFRPGQRSQLFPLAPVGAVFVGDPGIPNGIVPATWTRFAPRVGFAYDPGGNGKTSIRGGYGVFSDTMRLVNLNNNPTNQPWSYGLTTFGVQLSDPYSGSPQTLDALKNYTTPTTAQQRAARQFFLPLKANTVDPSFTSGYMQQWNLNVQREIWGKAVITVAYIGSKGTKLVAIQNTNPAIFIPGQSTTTNVNARRIYPSFEAITSVQSSANSTYHALQVSWNRRFASGFTILGSYVWSKAIDLSSYDGGSGAGAQASNPFNWNADKGLADFDIRHRFVNSAIWDLPFFKSSPGVLKYILGSWQLNGILTLQTGVPFTVFAGVDRSLAGIGRDRADVLKPVAVYNDQSRNDKIARYFDTTAFALPALGTFGTVGRNTISGPGLANLDVGLFKVIPIAEKRRFEIRGEAFNVLNRPNFGNPVNSLQSGAFGRLTSARDPRILQVAAKFYF